MSAGVLDFLDMFMADSTPEPIKPPRPTVRKSRHFYRCEDCLSVVAVETKLPEERGRWSGRMECTAKCGACGAHIEYMGETRYTVGGHEYAMRYPTGEFKPACDGKCIGAVGPNCDCQCGGENHGTGNCVEIFHDSGVPKVRMPEGARAKADAYRALVQSIDAAWDARYGDVTRRKRAGEWINNFQHYQDGQNVRVSLSKARALRTHAGRNKRLHQILTALTGAPA